MGSAKKLLKSVGLAHSSSKTAAMTDAQKVAAGQGRMLDGVYTEYSEADKAHYDAANENRNAEYQDISSGSSLGTYGGGNNSLLESIRKRKNTVVSTLLGGNKTNLGG